MLNMMQVIRDIAITLLIGYDMGKKRNRSRLTRVANFAPRLSA